MPVEGSESDYRLPVDGSVDGEKCKPKCSAHERVPAPTSAKPVIQRLLALVGAR
jgi:hypothetical protein